MIKKSDQTGKTAIKSKCMRSASIKFQNHPNRPEMKIDGWSWKSLKTFTKCFMFHSLQASSFHSAWWPANFVLFHQWFFPLIFIHDVSSYLFLFHWVIITFHPCWSYFIESICLSCSVRFFELIQFALWLRFDSVKYIRNFFIYYK